MFGVILQILTGLFGAGAVWIVGRRKSWYKWGYIVGFISQFFWLALFIYFKQYWMIWSLTIYCYAWSAGFWNHWIKK